MNYSREQIYDAMRAAHAAGDADAVRRLMAALDQPAQKAAPVATSDSISMGLADPFQGGAQLLTKMLPESVVKAGDRLNNWLADKTGLVARLPEGGVDQQTREREAAYQAQRKAAGEDGVDWWRLGGNVLSPANAALAYAAPMKIASLTGRIAAGAGTGAAASALAPVSSGDFSDEKMKQIGVGAAFGGAVPAAVAGFGRMVSPKASLNADVSLLRKEGVKDMTLGQALGGRWNAAEEKLQSLPIMGDMITSARNKALGQFNKAAVARATSPIGEAADDIGHIGVSKAGDALSNAYDDVLSSLKVVKFDGKFSQDASQLRQMAKDLTPTMRNKFNATYKNILAGRTSPAGGMTAETMKRVDSEVGGLAARYGKSSVASEQELGDALKQLKALLREQVGRNSPQAAKAIKAADTGWANLVRVEGAAKAAKNHDGIFTPAQLNQAVQTADQSVRKRAVSRGSALMQDLAGAGQNVLGNKVPNSGTAERLAYGVGGLASGWVSPAIPAALIGGAGLYTSPMQRLLTSALLTRPESAQSIAGLLNQSAPMLGPAGGLLALEIGK